MASANCSKELNEGDNGGEENALSWSSDEEDDVIAIEGPQPMVSYLPPRLELPGPSERILRQKKCLVKIVNVIGKNGRVDVVLEDDTSKDLFNTLLRKMSIFYGTAEGFGLRKEQVVDGEIVAATVPTFIPAQGITEPHVAQKFRRVMCTTEGAFDIDDQTPCRLSSGFYLIDEFYRHPVQSFRLRISNFHDLYPKNVFEVFFDQQQDGFRRLMGKLSVVVLRSISLKTVVVNNLESEHKDGQVKLTGKLHLGNVRSLEANYVEAFCNYFIPKSLALGEIEFGEVTDVDLNGDISICADSSLFQPINQLINEASFIERYKSTRTKDYEVELSKKVRTQTSFLAFDDEDKSRIYRVKILFYNHHRDTMKVSFLDKAKIGYISFKNLVCASTNNENVPGIFSLVPSQAVRYHLAGEKLMTESKRQSILGKEVQFKVVHRSALRGNLPEIEIDMTSSDMEF